ncbi:hypothetical protein TRFO_25587 [Tritrichomonas foetus]|uniref:Uncharacterized protein n=1 Tax=Tritrichomonas foetus TaxID=1144522 RepID=A0A1J4KA49_9EUKA|nr:hypothetical protein TRFO_25587 [Tritrichomonas foetus]|eukprot:OHT06325.1 hypothetical protein TRFO_25587 [Tritrichomonas foetus]
MNFIGLLNFFLHKILKRNKKGQKKMNTTILGLHLLSVSQPAYSLSHLSNSGHSFSVSKSSFQNFFFSAFILNPSYHATHFSSTKFENFLASAISMNRESFSKQIINESLDFYGKSCSFYNCLFQNCISVEMPGGAIDMSADDEHISINIEKCSFYNCRSEESQGGAIYCDCENASVLSSCFERCITPYDSGQAVQFRTTHNAILMLSSATNCQGGDRSTFYISDGTQTIKNLNLTSNRVKTVYAAFNSEDSDDTEMSYIDIVNSYGYSILGLLDKNSAMEFVNFINDTIDEDEAMALILVTCSIKISNSVFVKSSKDIVEGLPNEKFIVFFDNCRFDTPIDQLIFSDVSPNTAGAFYEINPATVKMTYFDSVNCWTIIDDDQGNSSKLQYFLAIPVVIFVALIVFGIVIHIRKDEIAYNDIPDQITS